MEKIQHPNGETEWRFSGPRPSDLELLANHTRRMMHRMYFAVTNDFYGATLPLATRNPFQHESSAGEQPGT
jgi:hypothetical protein